MDKFERHFQTKFSYKISNEDIFNALYLCLDHRLQLEWPGDIWDINLDFEQAVTLLEGFDFSILHNTIETPDDWIPKNLLIQRKGRFKHKNQNWIIHKYDQDPFPSSPHAHDIENGLKLDLSNGKCYKIKKHVHTINKKQLNLIRAKAEKVYSGKLPDLEC